MLPIVLAAESIRIGLAGAGEGHARRSALLAEAGLKAVAVAPDGALPDIRILFIAGLDADAAAALAVRARAAGILVNAEDMPELCDFHVPAIVRRGDLVLTASTGGQAPGLARRLREWLSERFGPEWRVHMEEISLARAGWRADGLPPDEVSHRTRTLVGGKGWLQ
ncbi:MAG TPA: NAD(P)-dependent oxidoreductase [Rhizomicrobium sp.]|nr:NAD(P)-dependent oxidoreductase [Rhizomicrobium sp.]